MESNRKMLRNVKINLKQLQEYSQDTSVSSNKENDIIANLNIEVKLNHSSVMREMKRSQERISLIK